MSQTDTDAFCGYSRLFPHLLPQQSLLLHVRLDSFRGLYCLLVDCVMIAFALVLGMVSLKITPQLKEIFDEEETTRVPLPLI